MRKRKAVHSDIVGYYPRSKLPFRWIQAYQFVELNTFFNHLYTLVFSKNHQPVQQLSVISNADTRLTGNQKDPQERLNTTNKKKAKNTPGYINNTL